MAPTLLSSINNALSDTASTLDTFGKEKLAPAVNAAGEALDAFSKDKVAPVINDVGNALDSLNKDKLGPAIASAGVAIEELGRGKAVPAAKEAAKALDAFGKEKVAPAVKDAGKALDTFHKEKLGSMVTVAEEWVGEHPVQTAMIAGSLITFVVPGVVSGPLLWIFGIGGTGVRAGTAAAAVHSSIGNVVAGSAFATAQSAGMGGYGIGIFHTVVRVGAALTGTFGGVFGGGKGGREKVDAGEETVMAEISRRESVVMADDDDNRAVAPDLLKDNLAYLDMISQKEEQESD